MSDHHTGARQTRVATPDREPDADGVAASGATALQPEGHTAMKTATISSSDLPRKQQSDRPSGEGDLSARELVAVAERHAAAGEQGGLDAVRAEAEHRARDQAPASLSAQIAGYIGLLAEDTDHALADEAHAWGRELHRTLDPADDAVPASRQVSDRTVRS